MKLRIWTVSIAVCALLLIAVAVQHSRERAAASLPQVVYVWQRAWDDSLRTALVDSRDLFSGLRVLALQFDIRSQWNEAGVDLSALAADGREVVLVLRIDGAAMMLDVPAATERLDAKIAAWRAAGVRLGGVEIDHDCATARLADYTRWLTELRHHLPANLALSITALPTWRHAPDLDALLATVDASVLQVHAVQNPQRGLFDGELARRWIGEWADLSTGRPFYVALPAYGVKLHVDEQGRVAGVQAEQPMSGFADSVELGVDPPAIVALLGELETHPPPGLVGIAWFRLPREIDQRAWSMHTLRAVVRHQPLRAQLQTEISPTASGASDVRLRNTGNLDADLPATVSVDGRSCHGDGVNGYRYNGQTAPTRFERERAGRIGSGRSLVIGWLRCASIQSTHVELE